ncbi:nucleotidyl transferase AbiEii/AbiGii toxin family protein [Streptomyces sp. A1277]|uniref:nucleotidyl transferase AbiEii/AbiGii toxin family protein n=1 Tax=Streptomyces sp. A1277 TaxID=2563103 RepID=UPI001F0F4686|nr:nucleotidyl transferase AbiEii/AbiGii toxin family protein [Streptomyces sp. A1277]
MADPTRDTTAGRVYKDLRNLARRNSRSTDEVMVEYILERFLYRLASSALGRKRFVLKGGLLPAQFGARRMTRDVDILGRSFPGTETEIIHRIAAIAATESDDGVVPKNSPPPSHSATSTPATATTVTSTASSPSTTWTAKNSPQR